MFVVAGPIPLRVREAEIPIVSDAECIRKINAVTEKIFILPASSFCAGGEEGNDACQVVYLITMAKYTHMQISCDAHMHSITFTEILIYREMEADHWYVKTMVSMNSQVLYHGVSGVVALTYPVYM